MCVALIVKLLSNSIASIRKCWSGSNFWL